MRILSPKPNTARPRDKVSTRQRDLTINNRGIACVPTGPAPQIITLGVLSIVILTAASSVGEPVPLISPQFNPTVPASELPDATDTQVNATTTYPYCNIYHHSESTVQQTLGPRAEHTEEANRFSRGPSRNLFPQRNSFGYTPRDTPQCVQHPLSHPLPTTSDRIRLDSIHPLLRAFQTLHQGLQLLAFGLRWGRGEVIYPELAEEFY
jgi:hypothetical protein